jgi:hypothetical protein
VPESKKVEFEKENFGTFANLKHSTSGVSAKEKSKAEDSYISNKCPGGLIPEFSTVPAMARCLLHDK